MNHNAPTPKRPWADFRVAVLSYILLMVILLGVVPASAEMFADFNGELPWATQISVSFAMLLRNHLWLAALVVLTPIAGGVWLIFSPLPARPSAYLLRAMWVLYGVLVVAIVWTMFLPIYGGTWLEGGP